MEARAYLRPQVDLSLSGIRPSPTISLGPGSAPVMAATSAVEWRAMGSVRTEPVVWKPNRGAWLQENAEISFGSAVIRTSYRQCRWACGGLGKPGDFSTAPPDNGDSSAGVDLYANSRLFSGSNTVQGMRSSSDPRSARDSRGWKFRRFLRADQCLAIRAGGLCLVKLERRFSACSVSGKQRSDRV